jgi:L-asparagine transporter-like permease
LDLIQLMSTRYNSSTIGFYFILFFIKYKMGQAIFNLFRNQFGIKQIVYWSFLVFSSRRLLRWTCHAEKNEQWCSWTTISFYFHAFAMLFFLHISYIWHGPEGFSEVVWDVASHNDKHTTFTYNSFDGEEGNVSFHG